MALSAGHVAPVAQRLPLRPQQRHHEFVPVDAAEEGRPAGDPFDAEADPLVGAAGARILREHSEPEAPRVGLLEQASTTRLSSARP